MILYKNIQENLPTFYKEWGISKGLFDKNYKGPREHFSHWNLWYAIQRDIKMSMLDIIENIRVEDKCCKKINNYFYRKISESDYALSKALKTYNKWQFTICLI
jgi:hypothetical protein